MVKTFYFLIILLVIFSNCSDSFEKEAKIVSYNEKIAELHNAARANMDNADKALGYAQEILRLALEMGSEKDMGVAYNIMGALSRGNANYVESFKFFLKSSHSFEAAKDTLGMAKVYNNIGNLYRDINKNDKAIKFYQQSLTAKTLLKDKRGMAITNRNIALLYQEMEDYEKAKDSYWTSLYIWKTLKDEDRMAESYNDLGIVYDLIAEKNASPNYGVEKNIIYNLYLNSLELCKKTDNKNGMISAYNNIAVSLMEIKEYDKALQFLEQSIMVDSTSENKEELATSYNNMGTIYMNQSGNLDKALAFFKLSEKFANDHGLKSAYTNLSEAYEKKGEFTEAMVYIKKLENLKERINNIQHKDELSTIEARYSIEYAGF